MNPGLNTMQKQDPGCPTSPTWLAELASGPGFNSSFVAQMASTAIPRAPRSTERLNDRERERALAAHKPLVHLNPKSLVLTSFVDLTSIIFKP